MKFNQRIMAVKDQATQSLLKHIWNDVHTNNFGFFGVVTGPPGSGKTETAMLLAYLEDMSFNAENIRERVFFEPKDFLKAIDEFDKYTWVVWSETGITLSSKKWQTMSNIMVEDVVQTMRLKKMGVIFDTQHIGFVDNRARSMFQWFTEVRRYGKRWPRWKIYRVSTSQILGKTYYPFPMFRMPSGQPFKLREVELRTRLPKPILKQFDGIHREWKEKLWAKHAKMIDKMNAEENPMGIHDIIEQVQENIEKYRGLRGNIDTSLIAVDFDIGTPMANRIKRFVEREIKIEKLKDRKPNTKMDKGLKVSKKI